MTITGPGNTLSSGQFPTLGLCIPTFNEAQLLPRLLDYLQADRHCRPILIVDGGSTDDTVDLARAHPLQPHISIIHGGRHAQLNAGLRQLTTTHVLFIPVDARILERHLVAIERQLASLRCGYIPAHATTPYARLLSSWGRLRCLYTNAAYMDQCPIVDRQAAVQIGGCRALGPYDCADLTARLGDLRAIRARMVVSQRHPQPLRATLRQQWQRLRHLSGAGAQHIRG